MSQGCNSSDINQTFIIEAGGGGGTGTTCDTVFTDDIISCTNNSVISLQTDQTVFTTTIIPFFDITTTIGTSSNRFLEVNTLSVNLGLDSGGETRILTANSSIFDTDILNGGNY